MTIPWITGPINNLVFALKFWNYNNARKIYIYLYLYIYRGAYAYAYIFWKIVIQSNSVDDNIYRYRYMCVVSMYL